MHALLSDEGQAAIEAAIEAIERRSAAEVVVSVHRRSGAYGGAKVVFGVLVAVAAQLFFLYSDVEFPLPLFVVGPLALGLLGAALGRVPLLERLFAGPLRTRVQVRLAAEAAFYRHGVGHTRERTGVAVFISLLERRVEVVADSGVLRQRPIEPWEAAVAALQAALARGGEVEAVTAALRQLGDVLALCLPWRDGINELENDVREDA
ncbi:MAG: hypothetical protein KC486_27070 [Myxococcales bacterium]|nr:hypothetical protein [Myxococcales bacterium]